MSKSYKVTWAKANAHGPLHWDAPGATPAEALENWRHCFGHNPDFKLVDAKHQAAAEKALATA